MMMIRDSNPAAPRRTSTMEGRARKKKKKKKKKKRALCGRILSPGYRHSQGQLLLHYPTRVNGLGLRSSSVLEADDKDSRIVKQECYFILHVKYKTKTGDMGIDACPAAVYDSYHQRWCAVRAQLEGHTPPLTHTSSPHVEMGRAGGAMMQA
jgi:hypothetical protein